MNIFNNKMYNNDEYNRILKKLTIIYKKKCDYNCSPKKNKSYTKN